MGITKSRLNQIIKEEVSRVNEMRRGGGEDWTQFLDPRGLKRQMPEPSMSTLMGVGQSGRMSDKEAQELGARGHDEPYEPDIPAGRRRGSVHATVSIYLDPDDAAKLNKDLARQFDMMAHTYLDTVGYDSISGNFAREFDKKRQSNIPGDPWTLSRAADGTFRLRTGTVIGTGETASEALADAAQQGFDGSPQGIKDSGVVLSSLGVERDEFYAEELASMYLKEDVVDGSSTFEEDRLDESARGVVGRWNKLAGTLKD
jgi:hypothetical protein